MRGEKGEGPDILQGCRVDEEGWRKDRSKGDVESTRRKGTGTGKLRRIKGDGWGGGEGVVSVCVVIKRFMGVEGEGGGLRLFPQPLFLLYSLNLGCVDRLGWGWRWGCRGSVKPD